MIIIHDTFVCKPGNASKLAKLFKEWMGLQKEMLYVMTDMTGQWHRVVMVSQYKNLTAYEKSWEQWQKPTKEMKKMESKMKGMNEMYVSGSREIYKVW